MGDAGSPKTVQTQPYLYFEQKHLGYPWPTNFLQESWCFNKTKIEKKPVGKAFYKAQRIIA